MKFTWKLLPLAALLVVGLFAFASSAQATIGTVKVNTVTIADGDVVDATTGDSLALVVNFPSSRPSVVDFTATSLASGSAIGYNFNDCTDNSVTADNCVATSGDGTNHLKVTDPDESTAANGLTSIAVDIDVTCTSADTINLHIVETTGTTNTADTFDFSVACSSTNTVITSVVTTTSAASFACNSITGTVTVTVENTDGDPISGASINLTASGTGTILETMPQTTGTAGTIVFHYYSPSTAQSVDFNATADNDATSAAVAATKVTVAITCAAASTATVPPPAPTTAAAPVVRAPATGDGGLAGGNNSANWTLYASLLLTVGGLVGGVAVAKRIRA
jgi:hypothetical protein